MRIIYVILMVVFMSSQAMGYYEERSDGSHDTGDIWDGSYVGEDGELR